MKKLLIAILLLVLTKSFFAQTKDSLPSLKKNAFYAEGFGNTTLYSLNYERYLTGKKGKLALRVGFAFIIDGTPLVLLPVMLNAVSDSYMNGHVEAGAGVLIAQSIESKPTTQAGLTFSVGYRYQKPKGRFLFRIGLAPTFFSRTYFYILPGISFGYAF